MITCPVCKSANHHLSYKCSSCGAFIQTKVENLDLFSTAWNVLEKPGRTLLNIAVAQHKNYTIILSSLTGVALTFFVFWLIKAGDHTQSLLSLLAAGFAISIPFGVLSLLFIAGLLTAIASIARVRVSLKNAFAVTVYSSVPLAISVILVLPLEIMSFGLFFFASNPSPYILKPTSYVLLLLLDGTFTLWSLLLFLIGVKKLLDVQWVKAAVIYAASLGIYAGIIAGALRLLL